LVRSATSDSSGQYVLSDVPAGHYQIKASLPGSTLANEPLRRNQYGFTLGGPIRRQISSGAAVDLAYVANKGTHVNQSWSINDPPPGQGAIQSRHPYPQWGSITSVR